MKQNDATKVLEEKGMQLTGKLKYLLTNDYLFKVFLQQNEKALRGLLSALLKIKLEDIRNVVITNPIQEGDVIDDKTMILDVKLIMNSNKVINIEMQVRNLGDWPERSLGYLSRAFDQLNHGEDYLDVKETIHIGILDFTPTGFPEKLYSEYFMMEKENHHIYSRKFSIRMLQLNQLGNLEDEEKMPEVYHWAQLFKATTWEEVFMVAEKNEAIKEGIVTLKQLTEDEKEQQRIEGRLRYESEISAATHYGEKLGREEGNKEGEDRFAKLAELLLQNQRMEDLRRASSDEAFRTQLFTEFGLL